MQSIPDYGYSTACDPHGGDYIWPAIARELPPPPGRAIDVGCGNGYITERLHQAGFEAIGVDPSPSGIEQAQTTYPECSFFNAEASPLLGAFDLVVCTEVIEHVYDPTTLANTLHALTAPGGLCIVTTPYHGYTKNLALALLNKWDAHLAPGWHGGHIKFFSPKTLTLMLREAGFKSVSIRRVGRIPPLAKSMVAICR
jgi:2-polyprenyl-3-methyl-5-hydroxy-6-metoxy-1,4-benzoquinol methylase